MGVTAALGGCRRGPCAPHVAVTPRKGIPALSRGVPVMLGGDPWCPSEDFALFWGGERGSLLPLRGRCSFEGGIRALFWGFPLLWEGQGGTWCPSSVPVLLGWVQKGSLPHPMVLFSLWGESLLFLGVHSPLRGALKRSCFPLPPPVHCPFGRGPCHPHGSVVPLGLGFLLILWFLVSLGVCCTFGGGAQNEGPCFSLWLHGAFGVLFAGAPCYPTQGALHLLGRCWRGGGGAPCSSQGDTPSIGSVPAFPGGESGGESEWFWWEQKGIRALPKSLHAPPVGA